MPTAGRLIAGVVLAALGAVIAFLTGPLFDEGQEPSYWFPLCILAGLWSGWVVMGKRAGRGYSAAVGNGVTGVLAQVFWILFIVSSVEMVKKSLRRIYDGAVEAAIDVFAIMTELAGTLASWDVVVALVVGAVVAAFVSEFYAKRFG